MRLITFLLSLLEGPSRVRLLESEVAYLRRHVGVLMRAQDARDTEEMERRMARGLDDARAVMAGRQTTRLPGAEASATTTQNTEATDAEGGQP